MPHVRSRDGTVIGYETSGSGPVVVLVDGAMAHRGHLGGRPLAEALSTEFTVVAYDRRGRGESADTQPYAVEREIEDIEALIDVVGGPACLYGLSSGSVLALRAAAALGGKVVKLAVMEPPFGGDDEQSRREFAEYAAHLARLVDEGRNGDAVAYFLQDMLPPDVLDSIRQSPDWPAMEAVAPTLVYDNAVMGDGAVPMDVASAVAVPTLVLAGGDSPPFKHEAARALTNAVPHGRHLTLDGHTTLAPPEVIAPVLRDFFG